MLFKEVGLVDCISHLGYYKNQILGVSEKGIFLYRGKSYEYDYILPKKKALLNLQIPSTDYSLYKKNGLSLHKTFQKKPINIALHRYWYHLNSSQVLAINFFFDFIGDRARLDSLLHYLGIPEEADEATYECGVSEKTQIDFAISLKSGKYVYFEIKYTESSFGAANSKKTDYLDRKSRLYSSIHIADDQYLKRYQFIRNVILGKDGNYSVFLMPKFNKMINKDYFEASKTVENISDFKHIMVFWEDLLSVFPNERVFEKYFQDVDSVK